MPPNQLEEKNDNETDDEGELEPDDEDMELKPERSIALKVWDSTKDFVIAFIIVIIIIGSIWAYTGNWPPVVVIESSSMQHDNERSFLGVIDTGDMVLVKSIDGRDDIVSYMEGKRTGHETYSEPGDVLIFRKNGYDDITPVIHRALIWVEFNTTTGNSWDVPELRHHDDGWHIVDGPQRWYNITGTLVLENIGWDERNVNIYLGRLLNENFLSYGIPPHSGFITLGDNNRGLVDEHTLTDEHDIQGNFVGRAGGMRLRPIMPDWVIGKARGELPWFGLIKLYLQDNTITERAPSNSFTMLWVSIILIFAVPISIDIVVIIWERKREKAQDSGEVEEEDEFAEEEPPPPPPPDEPDDS